MPEQLPWRHFTGWAQQWAAQPTFLVGEYMFIVVAIVALLHARASGRRHVLAWIAGVVAGTANDVFFMALPLVDNFWQAQATIMITGRLPLYIPCVYVCFLYIPTVAVWRLGLPRWAAPAATGLAAILFYAPYDIIGAKFLWWTWHDTDLPIAARIVGSPIGSTMFVILLAAAYAWLLERGTGAKAAISGRRFAATLGLVAVGSTPLMMITMAPLQQLDGGLPGVRGLAVLLAVLVGVTIAGLRRRRAESTTTTATADRRLWIAVLIHFATLTTLGAVFDPARHVSTGIHQTMGECHVPATDIAGHVRYEFLCASDFDEEFRLDDASTPAEPTRWYTVHGTPHRDFTTWFAVLLAVSLAGAATFTAMLRAPRVRR